MSLKSGFDRLPNELYLCIFDYLNSIDLFYSFSNLNRRLNLLLKTYSRFTWKYLDLTKLNPRVFQFYCLQKQINNEICSITLSDEQFQLISFSSNNQLRQLTLILQNDYHLYSKQLVLLQNLQKLTVQCYALTWQKPFIVCQYLKQVKIHLKTHSDLVELINNLPIVEKIHATIDYEVTSCRDSSPSRLYNYSNKLIDFSYIIDSSHGLVYFVTDYSIIESLVRQLTNLLSLRLYVIGCMNTVIDGSRLENNLLQFLPKLEEFHLFIQSYGGDKIKSMDEFRLFKWNFGCYSNDLTDMHFLFTLPYQFERLDECLNEYFLNGIKTTFPKSSNKSENEKLMGMNNVKHVDLSCSITQNLLVVLRESFVSLESIRFSSSTSEYISPPSLARQSRFLIKSIRTIVFDQTCKYQSAFVRLLPNLNKLIIHQSLLNQLLDETGSGYVCQVSQLHVYTFQRHYLEDIINGFPNLRHLILKTVLTNDEGPIRSYMDCRCHHKHRPVSITDILDELLKSKLHRLKQIEVGCYFERDEEHIEAILSRVIRKHRGENHQFNINCEDFKSTRCGSAQILFF